MSPESKRFKFLPNNTVYDSVTVDVPVHRSVTNYLFCKHKETTDYKRTDFRSGPGICSDSFRGTVCCNCGRIIREVQVN